MHAKKDFCHRTGRKIIRFDGYKHFVSFIYCDTTTSTKLITFPRPKYQERFVTDNVTGKCKLVRKYVCSRTAVDCFFMNGYFMAYMYFSNKFVCNFKFLFAQLYISTNETTGIISINPCCSLQY